VFNSGFQRYELPFRSLHPLVGLAWSGQLLYGVEIFPHDDAWTLGNANLVAFDPRTGERRVVLAKFASLPNGLVMGPDGALYTSNSGISYAPGDGGVLRIGL
jgi:sugar lactone lactonase YvrE